MLTGLLHAHSGLRYLILLAGAVALVVAVFGLATGRPYSKGMRISASTFSSLLHVQVLLGFAILVSGRFYPALIGHIFLMLMAAVVAQVPVSVLRRRPMEERTYMPHLVGIVVAGGLIWAGVAAIGRRLFEAGMS
jgi:asparagine N-glycosylation enzyme membrane subunit Stt3